MAHRASGRPGEGGSLWTSGQGRDVGHQDISDMWARGEEGMPRRLGRRWRSCGVEIWVWDPRFCRASQWGQSTSSAPAEPTCPCLPPSALEDVPLCLPLASLTPPPLQWESHQRIQCTSGGMSNGRGAETQLRVP